MESLGKSPPGVSGDGADPVRLIALYQAALELSHPVSRLAFLERECADDAELRYVLEALLARRDYHLASVTAIVEESSGGSASELPGGETGGASAKGPPVEIDRTRSLLPQRTPPASVLGTLIAGRYKVREAIGEGGMGSVYLAEQTRPVRRNVALKLIKPGMDSKTILARFESERQALALMDHPNIAKVLDAGTTESGRPFFVMDLVKGVPVDEYCDEQRLGLHERLALFTVVCSAVQHAAPKGHHSSRPQTVEHPGRKPRRPSRAQGDRLWPRQGDERINRSASTAS